MNARFGRLDLLPVVAGEGTIGIARRRRGCRRLGFGLTVGGRRLRFDRFRWWFDRIRWGRFGGPRRSGRRVGRKPADFDTEVVGGGIRYCHGRVYPRSVPPLALKS